MLRIKVLNKKNHPFAHKIKLYGVSIEAILIGSFTLVVLFLAAYSFQSHKNKKQTNPNGATTERPLHTDKKNVPAKNN